MAIHLVSKTTPNKLETMKPSTQELKEMFDNNFDCWAKHKGEDGFPVMAMTNERFVEVVSNILALGKPEPLAKNKQYGSSYKQDPDFKCSFPNCNCDGFKC